MSVFFNIWYASWHGTQYMKAHMKVLFLASNCSGLLQKNSKLPFSINKNVYITMEYEDPPSILVQSYAGSQGSAGASHLSLGKMQGYTLDRSPVHCRDTCRHQLCTLIPRGNLDPPVTLTCMSLDCGRKPEYLKKTHANSTQKETPLGFKL